MKPCKEHNLHTFFLTLPVLLCFTYCSVHLNRHGCVVYCTGHSESHCAHDLSLMTHNNVSSSHFVYLLIDLHSPNFIWRRITMRKLHKIYCCNLKIFKRVLSRFTVTSVFFCLCNTQCLCCSADINKSWSLMTQSGSHNFKMSTTYLLICISFYSTELCVSWYLSNKCCFDIDCWKNLVYTWLYWWSVWCYWSWWLLWHIVQATMS